MASEKPRHSFQVLVDGEERKPALSSLQGNSCHLLSPPPSSRFHFCPSKRKELCG